MTPEFTLLARPGCHLCDLLAEDLRRLMGDRDFVLQVQDVESRDDWLAEYGLRIPVLMAGDGRELCEVHLNKAAVLAYVQSIAGTG